MAGTAAGNQRDLVAGLVSARDESRLELDFDQICMGCTEAGEAFNQHIVGFVQEFFHDLTFQNQITDSVNHYLAALGASIQVANCTLTQTGCAAFGGDEIARRFQPAIRNNF